MATISMFFFYLLTPVLLRTYLIWFMPVYAIGMYRFLVQFKNKFKKWVVPLYLFQLFCFGDFMHLLKFLGIRFLVH